MSGVKNGVKKTSVMVMTLYITSKMNENKDSYRWTTS